MKVEMTDLQRLDLQPGDHLAVRVKERMTAQQAATVEAVVRAWAGGDFPVLVLDDGASLEVVTAAGGMQEIVR